MHIYFFSSSLHFHPFFSINHFSLPIVMLSTYHFIYPTFFLLLIPLSTPSSRMSISNDRSQLNRAHFYAPSIFSSLLYQYFPFLLFPRITRTSHVPYPHIYFVFSFLFIEFLSLVSSSPFPPPNSRFTPAPAQSIQAVLYSLFPYFHILRRLSSVHCPLFTVLKNQSCE